MSEEPIAALDHLVLTVEDIQATCTFYQRALGLRRVEYGDGRVALAFGAQKINLHATTELHPPVALRPVPGSADLCFTTAGGLGPVLRRLRDAGVPLIDGPVVRTGATGPIASVYLRDPDGNLIEVGAPHERAGEVPVRRARPGDREHVESLLRAASLPLEGLDDAWPRMLVAGAEAKPRAAAGLEAWDGVGLLRSVVVEPDARGHGIGEELVWRVLAEAGAEGVREVWLLTFIPEWFERRGFVRAPRAAAPAALHRSAEFRGACPDSAAAMAYVLGPRGVTGPLTRAPAPRAG